MYSENENNPLVSAPEARGRAHLAQETGAGHADEEYASELSPRMPDNALRETEPRLGEDEGEGGDGPLERIGSLVTEEGEVVAQNKSLGIVALVLAAISLFFLPAVLGPASVVVGFAAYVRGNRALGIWSMALGLLAVAAYYVLAPYYT